MQAMTRLSLLSHSLLLGCLLIYFGLHILNAAPATEVDISFAYHKGQKLDIVQQRRAEYHAVSGDSELSMTIEIDQNLEEHYQQIINMIDSDKRPLEMERVYNKAEQSLQKNGEEIDMPPKIYLGEKLLFKKTTKWTVTNPESLLTTADKVMLENEIHWQDIVPTGKLSTSPTKLDTIKLLKLYELEASNYDISTDTATIKVLKLEKQLVLLDVQATVTGTAKANKDISIICSLQASIHLNLDTGIIENSSYSGEIKLNSTTKKAIEVNYSIKLSGNYAATITD